MKALKAAWASVLTFINKYILSDYFKKLVVEYAVAALGATKGVGAMVVSYVVKKLWDYVESAVRKEIIREHLAAENLKSKEAYEKIINDPNSTIEDIKNAASSFLGGDVTKRP